jgi:hypothetical protein
LGKAAHSFLDTYMQKIKVIALFLLSVGQLLGQDTSLLTKNYHFTNGIYFNFEQLRRDQPAFAISKLVVHSFTNPQTSLTQVDSIFLKGTKQPVPLDSIWAICLDGVPSIRVPSDEINKQLPNFAALKLRGKIGYYTYPDYRTKKVRVAAYNPLTGRPFRQGYVEREQEVFIEKILHFQTGEVKDFTVENLLTWIQDDPLLVETLTELPKEEQHEKLFKCLLIYVDRNPAYIVKNEE